MLVQGCRSAQMSYVSAIGEMTIRERLDLEAHAATCPECADALREARLVDRALRAAFAPLAERRAILAPGRVRMALGPAARRRVSWLRAPSFFARLAEVSVAVGVALFAITGTVEEPRATANPVSHSVIQDYFRSMPPSDDINYFRWLRLQPAPAAQRADPVRLPVGGRFDVEPDEIVTRSTSTPR
jgi:hypothetical protein